MTIKEKLAAGEKVVGTFITLPAPGFVEVCAIAGFDFVVIDREHAALGTEDVENLIRAAEVRGAPAFVRVEERSQHHVLQALDAGAAGVHVPDIRNSADGCAAVAHAKYGPVGSRGLAGVRAAGYGLQESLESYAHRANQDTTVVVHIESAEAIERLDELLIIDGIDVYYLGPVDLSNDLGIPGRTTDPGVVRLVDEAIAAIIRGDRVAGCIVNGMEDLRRLKGQGVQYFACHALRFMLAGVAEFLGEARS